MLAASNTPPVKCKTKGTPRTRLREIALDSTRSGAVKLSADARRQGAARAAYQAVGGFLRIVILLSVMLK